MLNFATSCTNVCLLDKEDVCIVFISEMSDVVPLGSGESFSVEL